MEGTKNNFSLMLSVDLFPFFPFGLFAQPHKFRSGGSRWRDPPCPCGRPHVRFNEHSEKKLVFLFALRLTTSPDGALFFL